MMPYNAKLPKDRSGLIAGIRELTREDLARLTERRDNSNVVTRLRDPHHRLARLLASGVREAEAAAMSGYTIYSVTTLKRDPSFKELVETYRKEVHSAWLESQDAFYDLATSNMLKAERHIAERIEEKEAEGELLSIRDALAISRDAADRFGYGKKSTNVNVNVDFAAKLERASRRSATVIDQPAALRSPQPAGGVSAAPASPPRQHQQRVLRRA